MSSATESSYVAATRIAPGRPPVLPRGHAIARLRRLLFASPGSALATLVLASLCAWLGWWLFEWGVRDAVFRAGSTGAEACRAPGAGACWAFVGDKLRLVLFGIYPYEQQWRPAVATLLLVGVLALSSWPRMWRARMALTWAAVLAACALLMFGGLPGLPFVPDDAWGGLPVTLVIATFGIAGGFALSIPLALARHSRRGGMGKALAVAYIELARSVPLLAVLFLASVMIPLFLPQGMDVSKLLRVVIAFALFTAAYLAEVVRGGLMSVPPGQQEAATALGLSRFAVMARVVLPQALFAVLPALVNVFISFFKASSIVVVIGLFDLMTAANRAAADAQWQGFGTEVYLFVGAIYFVFCGAMSWYSARLQAARRAGRPG